MKRIFLERVQFNLNKIRKEEEIKSTADMISYIGFFLFCN